MMASPSPEAVHGTVRLEIPARAEWVAVARLAVAAIASRLRFSVDEIEDVKLAIAEACTNSIQHSGGDEAIEILCAVNDDSLAVTVQDHGQGVRIEPVEAERIGDAGRTEELGVFLIRALMDEVEYTTDSHGTQLVMTKRVSQ